MRWSSLQSAQLPVVLSLLAACASARTDVEPPAPIPITAEVDFTNDVHWFRNSAEYQAVALQTYRMATDRLRELSAGRVAGSWAVVLDADETVLDNSEYQKRLAARKQTFANDTWNAWVREEAAGTIPGAPEFMQAAHDMGGRIAIVTNRDEAVCDATRSNLRRAGVTPDVVLCRPPASGDKNPRFAAVANGSAAPGMPPLAVLMWVGDNIQDFPALTQGVLDQGPSALDAFGRTYIMLPNPMYGSWERKPRR
jgi:acid phosphatase